MTGHEQVSEVVTERTCAWCGEVMTLTQHTGRPRQYCSKSCRNRASELRTIAPRLSRDLAAGRVTTGPVREIVERTVTITDTAPPRTVVVQRAPGNSKQWQEELRSLAVQLLDPRSNTAREHWQHNRLLTALQDVLAALNHAHPGGLAHIPKRPR